MTTASGVRRVAISYPSGRDELVNVVRAIGAIALAAWLYLASTPGGPGTGGELMPFQALVQSRTPIEQRMFRELQEGDWDFDLAPMDQDLSRFRVLVYAGPDFAREDEIESLRDWVEEVASGLEGRVSGAEHRMDGCVSHTSVVRYDAMNELSGQQSSTVALLDERQTGVVISSILHRDQARLYVKRVQDGNPEYELSPEEQEAVQAAMAKTPISS